MLRSPNEGKAPLGLELVAILLLLWVAREILFLRLGILKRTRRRGVSHISATGSYWCLRGPDPFERFGNEQRQR